MSERDTKNVQLDDNVIKLKNLNKRVIRQELRGDIEAAATSARELHVSTRRKMGDLGQSLPPDTGAKLANLELGAEQAVASLGEAEQEHKRARTVRYDFQVTAFFNHMHMYVLFLI